MADQAAGHLTTPILRITVRPTATAPVSPKFLGEYREVLSAPPLPAALMPTYSSGWSPTDTGQFDQTMIWQNTRVASITVVRSIAREWPDLPYRSQGFFILYDSACATTAEWYRAPARSATRIAGGIHPTAASLGAHQWIGHAAPFMHGNRQSTDAIAGGGMMCST